MTDSFLTASVREEQSVPGNEEEEEDVVTINEEVIEEIQPDEANPPAEEPAFVDDNYNNYNDDDTYEGMTKDSRPYAEEETIPEASQAPPPPSHKVGYEEDYDVSQRQHSDNVHLKAAPTNASSDKCCGFQCCGYPNGLPQVFTAQVLIFCGLCLCSSAFFDCKFIEATAGYPEPAIPYWNQLTGGVTAEQRDAVKSWWEDLPPTRRGFGFIFNETMEGGCGFDEDSRYWDEDEFFNYQDFLGSDWNLPRAFTLTAVLMGWFIFFWSLTFICFSYARPFRLVVFIMVLVMIGFQASSFAIIGSDFCEDSAQTDCTLSRGAWLAIAGLCCYFLGSILILCMHNHVV